MAFKDIYKVSCHQQNWESKTVMCKRNLPYLFSASMKMLDKGCKGTINMSSSGSVSNWAQEIPNHRKYHEMCNETMLISLIWPFYLIPDHFKTQYMCIKACEEHSGDPLNVFDHFKMQEMCGDTVRSGNSYLIQSVSEWPKKSVSESQSVSQKPQKNNK